MLLTKNKFKSLLKPNMQKNNSVKTFKKCTYANREKQIWKRELGGVGGYKLQDYLQAQFCDSKKTQDYGKWKYKDPERLNYV